jgi:hypothetical protein
MPTSILDAIISRELAAASCHRILSGDGITSPDLTLKAAPGIFAAVSVDARSAKKSVPELAEAASAAKNLDEYQFLICSLVPMLPDSNPCKMELQKYRVAIFAAFARLVGILNEKPQELGEWSKNARWIVEETSEAYLQAKSGVRPQPLRHREAFEYFGVPDEAVISSLRSFYGQQ